MMGVILSLALFYDGRYSEMGVVNVLHRRRGAQFIKTTS